MEDLQAVLTFSSMVAVSYVSTELLMPVMDVVGSEHDLSSRGAGCPVFPEVQIKITDDEGNVLTPTEEDEEPPVGNLLLRTPFIFKVGGGRMGWGQDGGSGSHPVPRSSSG